MLKCEKNTKSSETNSQITTFYNFLGETQRRESRKPSHVKWLSLLNLMLIFLKIHSYIIIMNIWLPGILVFLILVPILYDEVDDIIDEI